MSKKSFENEYMNNDEFNKSRNEQLPWIEKHRPTNIEDIIFTDEMKKTMNLLCKHKDIPHLILAGNSGTGKTSSARCLARILYGKYYNDDYVIEINASDDRGIKIIDNIDMFCKIHHKYKTEDEGKYFNKKLIILDEADNLLKKAQSEIVKKMDEYQDHIVFAFTCNTSFEIIESIQSRCKILRFEELTQKQITERLKVIADLEKIDYEKNVIEEIASLSSGDLRSAIKTLQQLSIKYKKITIKNVYSTVDIPPPQTFIIIFDACINKNKREDITKILEISNNGYSGNDILLGMKHTLKSHLVSNMKEEIKIRFTNCICDSLYNISRGIDTKLQLQTCIINMWLSVPEE
jgi:DNA polymerase III delta prime subunit